MNYRAGFIVAALFFTATGLLAGCGSEPAGEGCASGVVLDDGTCQPTTIDDAGDVSDLDVATADGSGLGADVNEPEDVTVDGGDIAVDTVEPGDDGGDVAPDATICTPACEGRECGNDGCGGTCGNCATDSSCSATGICEPFCIPVCADVECGNDGCGGSCGECAPNFGCNDAGSCEPLFGDDVCPDVLTCADACATEACIETCVRAGNVAAQTNYRALQTCTTERCPLLAGEELGNCRASLCNLTWSACYGVEPTSGDLTCVETARCMIACTTPECEAACLAQGTVAAQGEVTDLFACADAECTAPVGSELWVECVEVACPAAELCLEGPPIAGGCSPDDRTLMGASGATARGQIAACGNECADVLGPDLCARDCVETTFGVSTDCAVCGAELAVCIAVDCAGECENPSSAECNACLDDDNCLRDFDRCLARAPGGAP